MDVAPPKKMTAACVLTSGVMVKPHFATKTIQKHLGKPQVGQIGFSRAVRNGELLRGKVSQGSTSPLKLCVKG